jgi:hypothetical protein
METTAMLLTVTMQSTTPMETTTTTMLLMPTMTVLTVPMETTMMSTPVVTLAGNTGENTHSVIHKLETKVQTGKLKKVRVRKAKSNQMGITNVVEKGQQKLKEMNKKTVSKVDSCILNDRVVLPWLRTSLLDYLKEELNLKKRKQMDSSS